MLIPQKSQYAVRAVFELARRWGQGPVKINEMAEAQLIPLRFLEVILSQLKQSGFIDSRRGTQGGYYLTRTPASISVGEVLQFMQGSLAPVDCSRGSRRGKNCAFFGHCVFQALWNDAEKALDNIFDGTTFQDLLDREAFMGKEIAMSYTI